MPGSGKHKRKIQTMDGLFFYASQVRCRHAEALPCSGSGVV
jgi:hypothetical protein